MLAKVDIKSVFELLPYSLPSRSTLARNSVAEQHFYWPVSRLWIALCTKAVQNTSQFVHLDPQAARSAHGTPLFRWFSNIRATWHQYLPATLESVKHICQLLGVPLALEKVEGPSTQLTFLGITLDTIHMKACLLVNKIVWIKQMTTLCLTKKNATKWEILSLIGLLQHAIY